MLEPTPYPERLLTLPKYFPADSGEVLGTKNPFPQFYDKCIDHKVSFEGFDYLRDVYVSMDSIKRILIKHPDCAGFVLYCAKAPIEDVNDPTGVKKVDGLTIALVGVSKGGTLLNKEDEGACYFTRPCPPYCPTWGVAVP